MTSQRKSPHSDELAGRKGDHIQLADRARTKLSDLDSRFNYEPLFFVHPDSSVKWKSTFLGFELDYPVWISSMTGGTEFAATINGNLARLCHEFKLGMGLGSCRVLLDDKSRLREFAVKRLMPDSPLFANIGIAQLEELLLGHGLGKLEELLKLIEADGLIVHINPLQEWFQPEGDRFTKPPVETLTRFLEKSSAKVIVKEVGQGLGPRSLKALLELPVAGIELAAFGGTNFTLLEKLRGEEDRAREGFIHVGHSAMEMVSILNALPARNKEIIISGGIRDILDGYELKSKLNSNALIGMASAFLGPALADYETLRAFFLGQREALLTARALLNVKEQA